jgi:hydroxymethylbilane synthase
MYRTIRLGIRPSPLALKQAKEATELLKKIYPQARFSIRKFFTTGDKDKITPISDIEGSDFFTREIDQALLRGEIDFGLHCSKDLPDVLAPGLKIAFETPSLSPYDALVSRGNLKFKDLPQGCSIGVSSRRRKNQIGKLRSDLKIVDIRGNIDERLSLLDTGRIDSLIVAEAALIRLGLEYRIAEILRLDIFKTHPRQGSLAIVTRDKT